MQIRDDSGSMYREHKQLPANKIIYKSNVNVNDIESMPINFSGLSIH